MHITVKAWKVEEPEDDVTIAKLHDTVGSVWVCGSPWDLGAGAPLEYSTHGENCCSFHKLVYTY